MDLVYKNEKPLFRIAATIATLFWLVLIVGTIGIALIYLLLGFIIYLFAQSAFISHLKGNGVKVTSEQYPDLDQKLRTACQTVGVEEVPDMYLLRTDFFNALATKFLGRNFIVLFTDVVDALDEQSDAIDFYIGHELGHIHRKHLKWGVFLFPALALPYLGAAYRRAEEYTCDRYGAACCNREKDVQIALAAISAGDTRWKTFSLDGYLSQVEATRGFWMSFHELTSDYPWLTKRMAAATAFHRKESVTFPRRSKRAWLLAFFVPRVGGAGGGASLILTIAMIGVLAAIAIPAYQDYMVRADVGVAMEESVAFQETVAEYIRQTGTVPNSMADIGVTEESVPVVGGKYSLSIYEGGVIGIYMGDDAVGNEQYIVIEPRETENGVAFDCYGQNYANKYLPRSCHR
ncbi:MAG: M48 family metalloprotease [Pseudomonadota bacterium]